MNDLSILKKPLITEKNYKLISQRKYVFVVHPKADKDKVKLAFEKIFATKVQSVNIVQTKSKPRRIGRFSGRTKPFKKAIITLMPGQNLNLLDDVKETDATQEDSQAKKSIFARFKEQFINVNPQPDKKQDDNQ